MNTLLLDLSTWDLVIDSDGDIAVAADPYSQAQDAASAIRTFQGECYFDTTLGVDYTQILGTLPPTALVKKLLSNAALTVPGVVTANVFLSSLNNRQITGQVQITNEEGAVAAVNVGVIPNLPIPLNAIFILNQSLLGGPNVLG